MPKLNPDCPVAVAVLPKELPNPEPKNAMQRKTPFIMMIIILHSKGKQQLLEFMANFLFFSAARILSLKPIST